MSLMLSYERVIDCDVVIKYVCCPDGYCCVMILHPYWVELDVDAKTLMMDYEGGLVSLMKPIRYFNCGKL